MFHLRGLPSFFLLFFMCFSSAAPPTRASKFWTLLQDDANDYATCKSSGSQRSHLDECKRQEVPYHHTTIPAFGINTFNSHGLSQGAPRGGPVATYIHQLADLNSITCIQETHLEWGDRFTFRKHFANWGRYYSNHNSAQAGVLTLIPPSILLDYNVEQVKLDPRLDGHAVVVRLTPRHEAALANAVNDVLVFNAYMYTGDDKYSVQAAQLALLCDVEPAAYNYATGDWNSIDRVEDSTSTKGVKHTAEFDHNWETFLAKFRLTEVRQDLHTYYNNAKADKAARSSRVDRTYTSHSEVDRAVVTPRAYIPAVPTVLRRRAHIAVGSDGDVDAQLTQQLSPPISDHLPVCVRFRQVARRGTQLPSIPQWRVDDEFVAEFQSTWVGGALSPTTELDNFKQHAYETMDKIALRRRAEHSALVDELGEYNVCCALLRAISQRPCNLSRVSSLVARHPEVFPYINGCWVGESFDAGPLRSRIEDLLRNAEVAPDPLAQPNTQARVPGLAAQLKVVLPSTRERLEGLRPGGLDTEPTNDPRAMALAADAYWGEIWGADEAEPNQEECREYFSEEAVLEQDVDPNLPTAAKITDIILATNNSTTGPDGVPFIVYRKLVKLAAPIFEAVVQHLAAGGRAGKGFNLGRLFLLPKKDTMLAADTRPISVTNTDNRIVAKVVTAAILPALQRKLRACQKGSISGRRGDEHIRELNEAFYKAVEDASSEDLFCMFVDTKKAFDSIHHTFIYEALRKIGMPTWVINVIAALLADVAVTPNFGLYTKVWIAIKRGVKQGCPLSPLIFAVCMNALIIKLETIAGLQLWAYVDDLAMAITSLFAIVQAMILIDEFAITSGLGVNRDKSALMAAHKLKCKCPEPRHRHQRRGQRLCISQRLAAWVSSDDCPPSWRGIKAVDEYKHLGVWLGPRMTLGRVWSEPFLKATSRLESYRHVLRALSPVRRIDVFNIFVFPLFSYLLPFFPVPDTGPNSTKDFSRLVRNYIMPGGGTWSKYYHYIAGKGELGPGAPVRDIWAASLTELAMRADLSDYEGRTHIRPGARRFSSMRVTKFVADAGRELATYCLAVGTADQGGVHVAFDPSQFSDLQDSKLRKRMYECMVRGHLLTSRRDADLGAKIAARLRVAVMDEGPDGLEEVEHSIDPPVDAVRWVHKHFSSLVKTLPRVARHHQFNIYFNANVFERRVRRFANDGVVHACFLCGEFEDGEEHVYGACVVVLAAKRIFSTMINYDLAPVAVGATSEREVALLLFDPSVGAAVTNAITIFYWATWLAIRKTFSKRAEQTANGRAARFIAYRAAEAWFKCRARTWREPIPGIQHFKAKVRGFGSAGRRSKEQAAAARAHAMAMIAAVPPEDAIIYTDGSSNPNPGHCGAGLLVCWPRRATDGTWYREEIEYTVALGDGSNNIGELWAVGLAGRHAIGMRDAGRGCNVHLFSDSQLTIDWGECRARASSNTRLIHAVRRMLEVVRVDFEFRLHKVAGHVDVPGNDAADARAEQGSLASASGKGATAAQRDEHCDDLSFGFNSNYLFIVQ